MIFHTLFWKHSYMYDPRIVCKMQYLLNLVLENLKCLWFYLTFWVVISNSGLKLPKLSIHILIMLSKWLKIHWIIVWSSLYPFIFFCHICYIKFKWKCLERDKDINISLFSGNNLGTQAYLGWSRFLTLHLRKSDEPGDQCELTWTWTLSRVMACSHCTGPGSG